MEVVKTAGWALIRDKAMSGEYDAAHMLSPMPLAITLGVGASRAVPWTMPAVENLSLIHILPAMQEEQLAALRASLLPLRQMLARQPYLAGQQPAYADYAVRCV